MMSSKTTIAIPPGVTIREQLESRGMSQKEFALRMDLSEKHVSQLINGKVELTKDVALRLESVLGVPASFWNNLEAIYREKIARINAELEMERDEEIARKMPYSEMATLGWVPPTKKILEKVFNLRSYFEVARLELLEQLCVPGIAYRTMGSNATSDYALAAWAQKARIEARKISTKPIDIRRLEEILPEVRKLSIKDPEVFCPELCTLFAECGIGLVFLPHIRGSFLQGATFYDGNRIVMGLTVRGKYADKFWFSLFHEIYHILAGHISNPCGASEEEERQADNFARDKLIAPEVYDRFISQNDFSREAIVKFAKEIKIAPGIVLGRLQKENYVPYDWYNDLRIKYRIK